MKNMFLSLAVIAGIAASGNVSASCKSDFAYLQNKDEVRLVPSRSIELTKRSDFQNLRSPELKAVSNYVKFMNFQFNGENSLTVNAKKYEEKETGSSVGYRISVTDGGDESNVVYYIKIDVGIEDVAYPILYRVWHNQTPARDFLCETF